MQKVITDDLNAFLDVLPPHVRQPLSLEGELSDLLEVVLDLGRTPVARVPSREIVLSPKEVTQLDIDYVTSRISPFGDDNRAGIERTLHRISAIRNRQGRIVGLTCRVGRAVYGTIRIIQDLVESAKSILMLGRPGIGKTTMLREVARVLADDLNRRVVIVDTSNEIAGDGDIPHPAIGHARRMQVATPAMQHAVMIEAVENHMPQVIVIDEIGTELEAQAARTIAERGVQLVGTAHGNTLENLMMNPTLSDLVGGIQSVTLGDEEARRRGTQKSILERMAPPTFDIVVEIQDRDRVAIHPDTSEAVDAVLRGQPAETEVRWMDEQGEVKIQKGTPHPIMERAARTQRQRQPQAPPRESGYRIYAFGVNRGKLEEIARDMRFNLRIVENINDANLLVTSKQYYRRKPQAVRDAETANLPIYVLKSNTPPQMRQLLQSLFPGEPESEERERREGGDGREGRTRQNAPSFEGALREAQLAVNKVKEGEDSIELSPQSAYIRRLQHLMAERGDVGSRSMGRDPERRVVIYREEAKE